MLFGDTFSPRPHPFQLVMLSNPEPDDALDSSLAGRKQLVLPSPVWAPTTRPTAFAQTHSPHIPLSDLFRTNRNAYDARVKADAAPFTKATFAERCEAVRVQLDSGDKASGGAGGGGSGRKRKAGDMPLAIVVPTELRCPLTNELFVDPVSTGHGVYERAALVDYFAKHGFKDPITGQAITIAADVDGCPRDDKRRGDADKLRERIVGPDMEF